MSYKEAGQQIGNKNLQKIIRQESIRAIAISGRSGCGNTTVNQLVAAELGFSGVNYTMRSYAAEQGICLEKLAQQVQQGLEIDCAIDRRQVEMCAKGEVILSSRLAIWLLPKATLKVYLHASSEVRGHRIQQREGGTLAEQVARTKARDEQDAQRYKKFYQLDINDFFFADLIINTETFDQHQVANIIVQAYCLLRNPV